MAGRKCMACGRDALYLRPETGFTCKRCREEAHKKEKDRRAAERRLRTQRRVHDEARLPTEKRCPKCERTLSAEMFGHRRRKNRGGTVSVLLATYCNECARKDARERMAAYPPERQAANARRRRVLDPRPRVVDRWYSARKRTPDLTLEEYADHYERVKMGCKPSDWCAWQAPEPKEQALTRIDELRARADKLQRPVIDIATGRKVWPTGWSEAIRFAWRYENDEAFRLKQIERTKLRKYTMPSYGVASERCAGNRRKWQRAVSQMGKVTRAHLRRELRARLCSYCLEPLSKTNRQLDHVAPLSDGGAHDDDNIIACCSACNMSKGRKSLVGWLMGAPERPASRVP